MISKIKVTLVPRYLYSNSKSYNETIQTLIAVQNNSRYLVVAEIIVYEMQLQELSMNETLYVFCKNR